MLNWAITLFLMFGFSLSFFYEKPWHSLEGKWQWKIMLMFWVVTVNMILQYIRRNTCLWITCCWPWTFVFKFIKRTWSLMYTDAPVRKTERNHVKHRSHQKSFTPSPMFPVLALYMRSRNFVKSAQVQKRSKVLSPFPSTESHKMPWSSSIASVVRDCSLFEVIIFIYWLAIIFCAMHL